MIFNPKIDILLKLWSNKIYNQLEIFTKCWNGDMNNLGLVNSPWEIIRDIILPMTIDRKDTVKLIKKKKEEEKRISSRPCKRRRKLKKIIKKYT